MSLVPPVDARVIMPSIMHGHPNTVLICLVIGILTLLIPIDEYTFLMMLSLF